MNAEELLKNFQGMLNAYQEEHAAVAVADNTSTDMKKIISKARNAKFIKHILCTADQSVRDLYCTGLFSLFQAEKSAENRSNAMVFVGRIIASYTDRVDLDVYLVRTAKIDKKFWADFFEFIKGDVAFNFVVDALLMYYLSGRADAMLKGILDVVEVFSVDKKRLFALVKAILEQDVDGVANFGDKNFFGYGISRRLVCAKYLMKTEQTAMIGKWRDSQNEFSEDGIEKKYMGKEKTIGWYVIDVQENEALLITQYGIQYRLVSKWKFGFTYFIGRNSEVADDFKWSKCEFRKFLNGEFLSHAFSSDEKSAIVSSKTTGVKDEIFLLSEDEVDKYLVGKDILKCRQDIFGRMEPEVDNSKREQNGWFLRDSNKKGFYCVFDDGEIGVEEGWQEYLIRPAMWVKIDSAIFDM